VGEREVVTVADAEAALAAAPAVVLLSVERRGNPIFVAVRLADR